MPKASPHIRSFNSGEFSEWLRGRTDIDKHSSSLQKMTNFIAAPQGPAIARSGTKHIALCAEPDEPSYIQPFVFSNDDAYVLEFARDKMRVFRDDALVIDPATDAPYELATDFTAEERKTLRFVQSLDVVYIFNEIGRVRKLIRRGDADWTIEKVLFKDGPYLSRTEDDGTTLTVSGTGGLLGQHISTSSSGNRPLVDGTENDGTEGDVRFLGRAIDYLLPASDSAFAFDTDTESYWAGDEAQKGTISATYATPKIVTGYTIYASRENQDGVYLNKDYAPSSWTLLGRNGGGAWTILDVQEDYIVYDSNRSIFFEIANETAYTSYQLVITKLVTNGAIEPRVQALVLRDKAQADITVTASSTKGINRDDGFKATDVDRSLRMRGSDNNWRELRITEYVSPTVVKAQLIGEPFIDRLPVKRWRLGVWSDTTGWPAVGVFFGDRLFAGGSSGHEDTLAMSAVGAYETFAPTTGLGEVLDESGGVFTLNARRLARIRWVTADRRGVLMGTGSSEYTVRSSDGPFTARTAQATPSTNRGSAAIEPVLIDDATLFVQRSARTLREFRYIFEADGYRSLSLSDLASHFGSSRFAEIEYAAEPHGILWMRREDGSLVGFTYNSDQNVQGWHAHDLSGGFVVSLASVPDTAEQFDKLWLVIGRVVNGQTRYAVERLTRTWDFDMTIEDAWFVDAGVLYDGDETETVGELAHLEGETVYGLADSTPIGPLTVTAGQVELPFAARRVVIGLGFDSDAVTSEIVNGAADGTASGKTGRIHNVVAAVWRTAAMRVGIWHDDVSLPGNGEFEYDDIDMPSSLQDIETYKLYTGFTNVTSLPPSYTQETVIAFRRSKDVPLPLTVVALMPQLHKSDR